MTIDADARARRDSLLTISSIIALLAAGTALAQDENAAENAAPASGLEEVVVTAQFRAQNLQETPIAITAVDAATLDARSQTSIIDLGNYAPNVKLEPANGLNGNSIAAFIRGIGQSDSSFALEPGVGIYIDDIYYGTTFGAVMDLTDLERVEVLRGPQGTLSGKNSVGGAIKLFTRQPDSAAGGFVEATYGRFDRTDVRASGGFTITDELFGRISAVSKTTDGYMNRLDYGCVNPGSGFPVTGDAGHDCVIGTEGGRDLQAVRLSLRYAPADLPLQVNVRGDYATDKSEIAASKLLFADNPGVRSYVAADPTAGVPFDSRFITPRESYTTYADYTTSGNYTTVFGIPTQITPGGFSVAPKASADSWGIAATVDVDLSDTLKLTSITGYRTAAGSSGIDVDGSPLNILLQQFNYSHKQFTQEVRLSSLLHDGKINATLGAFYYDADDLLTGRNQIPAILFDFLTDDLVTNRSASAFAHVEFHLTDRLNLIGGLRYTDDKKVYHYTRLNIDGSEPSGIFFTPNFLLGGLNGLEGTFTGDRADFRVVANYDLTSSMMVYGQVVTGYKGGGINPRPSAQDQVLPFGPEKLTTYEMGLKSELFGRRMRLNAAAFLNDYTDIQLVRLQCPESVVLSCSAPTNAGNAQILGFELEASIEPVDGLQLDGSVGYLDFKYTEITNPATQVTRDMTAPFISKWQASAGLQYVAKLASGAAITPRLDWSYRSEFFYNALNTPFNSIDGYSLLNARLTFDSADSKWSVSAAATNLLDKFYYTGLSENIGAFGVSTGNPGRPREWSIAVRRSF